MTNPFSRRTSTENPELISFLRRHLGVRPGNIELYVRAFRHKSVAKKRDTGIKDSNERLEYLGDAVIGLIVAEILFEEYTGKQEGFLTQMRSRIVSRQNLNYLGRQIGIEDFIKYQKTNSQFKSLVGNAFEALFGAIYIDKGYKKAKKIFKTKIFDPFIDLNEIEKILVDFKSQLLIHCQKNRLRLDYRTLQEKKIKGKLHFTMGLYINNELLAEATALSKRVAEQAASKEVYLNLGLTNED